MYSKFFGALTSSQRARKHRLPYFSLKNVANIRVWLALRLGKTWLRRHRRERSADAVVSLAFYLSLALLAAILFEVSHHHTLRQTSLKGAWREKEVGGLKAEGGKGGGGENWRDGGGRTESGRRVFFSRERVCDMLFVCP